MSATGRWVGFTWGWHDGRWVTEVVAVFRDRVEADRACTSGYVDTVAQLGGPNPTFDLDIWELVG